MNDLKSKVEKAPKKVGKKPGSQKTGGRVAGTPNRNSFNFRRALDANKFDLVAEWLRLYSMMPDEDKIQELKYMLKYAYPTLKEIELAQEIDEDNSSTDIPTEDLIKVVKY